MNNEHTKAIILGQPVGKGRPRYTHIRGRVLVYTPKKTKDYESDVKTIYLSQNPRSKPLKGGVEVIVESFYKISSTANKATRALMLSDDIRPQVKPDIDNVIKILLDGLNGVAYDDDKQVVRIIFDKRYAEKPKTIITIREYDKRNNDISK